MDRDEEMSMIYSPELAAAYKRQKEEEEEEKYSHEDGWLRRESSNFSNSD